VTLKCEPSGHAFRPGTASATSHYGCRCLRCDGSDDSSPARDALDSPLPASSNLNDRADRLDRVDAPGDIQQWLG